MQEFAPKQSRPSGNCPSDEELAAYIDGVLGKEEAARIAEHLASCENCFEVYSETVHFQLESQPAPAGEVVPFPSGRKDLAPLWLAAAASLIVAVGGWYVYQSFLAPPPQIAVAEVAPDLRRRPVKNLLWDYETTRGLGEPESELARQSFQVGALLVDLHLAGQAGATMKGYRAWHGVGTALSEAPGMSEFSAKIFKEANNMHPEHNPVGSANALRSVATQASQIEAELRESVLFPEYIDLGKWTEAGRVAALVRDASFFKDRQNRRFLSYALEPWEPDMPKPVRKELEAISQIWEQGDDLAPSAFKPLASHFQEILDHYDF
jgi:hypothetical protein